jgi:hypothetical protein
MPSRILRINVQLEAMKKILIARSLGSLVDVSTCLISSESNEISEKKGETTSSLYKLPGVVYLPHELPSAIPDPLLIPSN